MSSDLIRRVLRTIRRHDMFRPGDRVGIGLSGGSDSVALFRILQEVSRQEAIPLSILHFNHGLRGADSEADEQFVAALAAQFGLPFLSGKADVAGVARARRWNLEDAGRRLRYAFFFAQIAENRVDRVAVAHTADDQAETVLARILRGTGPAGLAATYPVNGPVVRPLLEVRRAELREYLGNLGQHWREDASNYDRSRLRSRLRHELLPILEREIQPAIASHLGRLAAMSREDNVFWKALTRARLSALLGREGVRLRIQCSDLLSPFSNEDSFDDLPEEGRSAVSRRLVRGIVEQLRGHCRQWTADHVERVVQLARNESSGCRIELPGVTVERSFDWLWFYPADKDRGNRAAGSKLNSSAAAFSCLVELGNPGESTVVAVPEIKSRFRLKVVDWHSWRSDTEVDKATLDRDLLHPPLVLRNWYPGDSLQPKGRRSSHKLKHFFRIKRVAVPDRQGWPVLTSAGKLVWARGLPVAAEFAPRVATRAGVIIAEENL